MSERKFSLAVVVPVLNEGAGIAQLLAHLEHYRPQVVIVDGGSEDQTKNICENKGFRVIDAKAGRARQMNAGASAIDAECYWFLHADCIPPNDGLDLIRKSLAAGYVWGRFDVSLSASGLIYRIIERLMNWRSCLTRVATGDQGIFVSRSILIENGGYPDIPLMEDIAISKLLRKQGPCACIHTPIRASARRWQQKGVFRTILLMWWLRWRYFLGADPVELHQSYYGR